MANLLQGITVTPNNMILVSPIPFTTLFTGTLTPGEYALLGGIGGYPGIWLGGLEALYAKASAANAFPGQPEGNNQRNSFQHAYWSAMMAFRGGDAFAKSFGDAHETSPGSVKEEQFMDLHNNGVGIMLTSNHGNKFIQEAIFDAIHDGKMVVLDANNNIYFSNGDYPTAPLIK
jgi:hypothetical protein